MLVPKFQTKYLSCEHLLSSTYYEIFIQVLNDLQYTYAYGNLKRLIQYETNRTRTSSGAVGSYSYVLV
jgi:hypothetical protein